MHITHYNSLDPMFLLPPADRASTFLRRCAYALPPPIRFGMYVLLMLAAFPVNAQEDGFRFSTGSSEYYFPTNTGKFSIIDVQPDLLPGASYSITFEVVASGYWPHQEGFRYGLAGFPVLYPSGSALGAIGNEWAYSGSNWGFYAEGAVLGQGATSIRYIGDQIRLDYDSVLGEMKVFTKHIGGTEFTVQSSGLAFTDVFPENGRVMRFALSGICWQLCGAKIISSSMSPLTEASLSAADGVIEPLPLPISASAAESAIAVLDFTLADQGGDFSSLDITGLNFEVSGTLDPSTLSFRLNGPDVEEALGEWDADSGRLYFDALGISVSGDEPETYTVSAWFTDTSGVANDQTLVLALNTENIDLAGDSSSFDSATTVGNGSGSAVAGINVAPSATNVEISGSALEGQTVQGSYDFADTDGDTESGSALAWQQADDATGTHAVTLDGATSATLAIDVAAIGKYLRFQVTPSDGTATGATASSDWFGPVVALNRAPVGSVIPAQTATQDQAFNVDIATYFSDPDGDELTFTATGLPDGFAMTAAGVISGTPGNAVAQNGPYAVEVTATDPADTAVSATFELTVQNVNDAPVVNVPIPTQTASQNAIFTLDVSGNFSDPDGDLLNFTATGLPDGFSISDAGLISGTPGNSVALNGPYTISVTAIDTSSVSASSDFTLNVGNVNDDPVVGTAVADQTAATDAEFSLDISAHFSDPDGPALTYAISGAPAGLSVTAEGVIEGIPTTAGSYLITVTATDPDGASVSTTFTLLVRSFTTGDGSSTSPWEITSADQLNELRFNLDDHFVLTADIDLGGNDQAGPYWNGGAGWQPIGTATDPFTGSLDGGAYLINGLFIDANNENSGLFGFARDAEFQNVILASVDVSGTSSLGGLVGKLDGGSVSNSHVSGSLTGSGGGIGGLAGTITGTAQISGSYTHVDVFGVSGAGGIAGQLVDGAITASYATGTVAADLMAGGIAGSMEAGGSISETYAVVAVDAGSAAGGIVGATKTGATVVASIWNVDIASVAAIGDAETEIRALIGLTTVQMQGPAILDILDFDARWDRHPSVNEGRPFLLWQGLQPSNIAPTFTHLSAPVADGDEDTEVSISYADIAAVADEADAYGAHSDGGVVGFRVTSVSSGALRIGGEAFDEANNHVIDADRSATWRPAANAHGTIDAFTLLALDDEGLPSAAPVQASVRVSAVNDAPQVNAALSDLEALEETAFTQDVASHFGDIDGDLLGFSATGLPSGFEISESGVISGTADNATALQGSYAVTVTAQDPDGATTSDTFTLTVTNANDIPTRVSAIEDQAASTGAAFTLDVSGHFEDQDGDTLHYSMNGAPDALAIDADGVISGTPNVAGFHSVTITAQDPDGESVSDSFVLVLRSFTAGDGSSASPWEISSAAQLNELRYNPDGEFVLTADIDLGGADPLGHFWHDGRGWLPIGSEANPFTGTLDGAGYLIRGLYVDSDVTNAGLFGYTDGTDLRNVILATVDVSGTTATGGLVGHLHGGSILNSHVSGSVTGSGDQAGGLAGVVDAAAQISGSYVNVDVSGYTVVGGIAGELDGAVESSYANGSVSAQSMAGGLAGTVNANGRIIESYTAATVDAVGSAGGFAGSTLTGAQIDSSIWKVDGAALPGIGDPLAESFDITGLTDDQLRNPANFDGWDNGIWGMHLSLNDGYPYLLWQGLTPSNIAPEFTVLADPVATTEEDTGADVTFAAIAALGDQSDAYGESTAGGVSAFVVTAVSSGALLINGEAFDALHNSTIDAGSHATWLPPADTHGAIDAFTLLARDDEGLHSAVAVQATVSVNAVNDAPELLAPIGDLEASEEIAFSHDVSASFRDPDGDTLTFTADGLPAGFAISAGGVISGTASNAVALAEASTVTITATDPGDSSASASVTLGVRNVNDQPVAIADLDPQSILAGYTFSFDVADHFKDEDGDTLVFTATGLPNGLVMGTDGVIGGAADRPGEFTATIRASDPAEASVSRELVLHVSLPPPQETVIDDEVRDTEVNGDVTVAEGGVINGGTINGSVTNNGVLTGNLNLGQNASIHGGTISGNVTGSPSSPASINGAVISSGAELANVLIGPGTVLDPGVAIGPNVRFESNSLIPSGLDLTEALGSLQWLDGDAREVVDLQGDVVTGTGDAPSLIEAIQQLSEFAPSGHEILQRSDNGELYVDIGGTSNAVLPISISQAPPEVPEGVSINEDGDIVFVTQNRRVVISHPVLSEGLAFQVQAETMGLHLGFDGRTNLVLSEQGSSLALSHATGRSVSALDDQASYFVGRPDVSAVPAYRGDVPGIVSYPVPGIANMAAVSILFEDEDGVLMQQDIAPVPADWFALKAVLQQIPGATEVRIDLQGVISMRLGDLLVRARVDYQVLQGTTAPGEMRYEEAGDLNGDGVGDFTLFYSNGDRQALYLYP